MRRSEVILVLSCLGDVIDQVFEDMWRVSGLSNGPSSNIFTVIILPVIPGQHDRDGVLEHEGHGQGDGWTRRYSIGGLVLRLFSNLDS